MRVRLLSTVCALAFVVAGCGQSEEEKRAEEAKQAAEQVSANAGDLAKGLEDMANAKPVEPVSFRDLQAAFGDLAGWEKGKPTGERMTSPVNFSRAEIVMPYSMFLTAGYEKQTEDGYERSTRGGGHPAWETWNSESKNGELNAIVAKRFIVQVEGRDIEDIKVLHAAMATVDLAKLASLK